MHERLKDRALQVIEKPITEAFDNLFKHYSAPIESLFDINIDSQDLEEIVQQAVSGASIIFIGDHQSHADIIPMAIIVAKVINAIRQHPTKSEYPDCIVPMAASVQGNKQSVVITAAYNGMSSWIKDHDIRLIPVVTKNDAERRGMASESTISNVLEIIDQIEEGTAMAIFPEESVQGGRRIPHTNKRHGIREITKRTLLSWSVSEMRSKGKKLILVPIGFSGSYNVLDPDKLLPTITALQALAHNHRHPDNPTYVAEIKVGKPFEAASLSLPEPDNSRGREEIHYAIHQQVFERISELIPYEEKGVFR